MNKKTITLVMMLLLAVVGVKADVIPSSYYSEPAAGTFYLYNVNQGKFLQRNASKNWVDLVNAPISVTVIAVDGEDNVYKIQFDTNKFLKVGYYNKHWLWSDGDGSNEKNKWVFTAIGGLTKTYQLVTSTSFTISENEGNATGYFYANGDNAWTAATADCKWALISAEDYTTYINSLEYHTAVITANKGDATSLLPALTAWTGYSGKSDGYWNGVNRTVAEIRGGTMSTTLSNMPAGTYKLVGATRGAKNQYVTMTVNGTTSGNFWSYNADNAGEQAINLSGVQLPYSDKGGFNTTYWRWATITGTLAADGDLPLSIYLSGSSWNQVTDLHLYYMGDGENTYAIGYSDGVDAANHAVTCDIISTNPNKIFTSTATINNTNGTAISNNLVSGTVAHLVLYDGYEFSAATDFTATAATLYRSVAASSFATICAPFAITGGADGTFYQPSSLTSGTLNFETAASPAAGKAYLYKSSSAVTALTGSGTVKASPVDNGTGATMKGRYSTTTVSTGDYILSNSSLYKVGGTGTVTVNPFRAYFTVPSNEARINLLFDDDTPTFINTIGSQEQNADSQYYDLQGRKVTKPTKGLYIVNGKKVMMR